MGAWEQATVVALALFAVGIVYHAGRTSARLESLEQWRHELTDKLTAIADTIARLERKVPERRTSDRYGAD